MELLSPDDHENLHASLTVALGVDVEVRKTRVLLMAGRTRIHFDHVESLGAYMELEVVLRNDETPEEGEREARALMEALGITETDLVECAYADLLKL